MEKNPESFKKVMRKRRVEEVENAGIFSMLKARLVYMQLYIAVIWGARVIGRDEPNSWRKTRSFTGLFENVTHFTENSQIDFQNFPGLFRFSVTVK